MCCNAGSLSWDAALITADPQHFDDILYVMKLANLQLAGLSWLRVRGLPGPTPRDDAGDSKMAFSDQAEHPAMTRPNESSGKTPRWRRREAGSILIGYLFPTH
jgi:hypothetical protein